MAKEAKCEADEAVRQPLPTAMQSSIDVVMNESDVVASRTLPDVSSLETVSCYQKWYGS